MIREKVEASRERQLITLGIISTLFLQKIHPLCRLDHLKSSYARTVWSWISQYYQTYSLAPGKDIQDIYITHKLELDEDEETIATFLQSLSDEFDQKINNVEYAITETEAWLGLRSDELLRDALDDCITRKDHAGAKEAIAAYIDVKRVEVDNTDVLNDANSAVGAFTNEDEVLFRFPGALGAVCGDFKRTDFVAFIAAFKKGKSWWLLELAKQSTYNGLKTLLISLEMPKNQMLRRIWSSLTHRPKHTKMVRVPSFTEMDNSSPEKPIYGIEYNEYEAEAIETTTDFFHIWKKKYQKYFKGGDLRLVCMPSKLLTPKDLDTYLDNLQFYGFWTPDVIIVDYADLMASKIKGEERQQLNDIWMGLRRIAQQRSCLMLTATQSNRAGLYEDLTLMNLAEDIRKAAHVTKLLAINATKEEQKNGICRIAQLAERDDEAIFEQAVVLSCHSLGAVVLDSRYRSEVYIDKSQ
jgi:hypothetical protein